jgi:hypothetical protein
MAIEQAVPLSLIVGIDAAVLAFAALADVSP